jgi:PHD/YefM family antitoxin component YafN of YafNO toxin-antitoxin module
MELNRAIGPLREYAKAQPSEPLVLTTRGKPVAALIHLDDADWESVSLSLNPKFIALLERCRRRARKEGTISLAEVKRQLGIPDNAQRRKGDS